MPGEYHPAFEEYCECIYELHEDDVDAIQARIADRLNITRPAVSEMIKRMESEGLIATGRGTIELSARGRDLAERVVRRHRLAERFLTDILGLSWAQAHREAGKWEHVMSDDVEHAMDRVLGTPTTCPHGNPIPGSSHKVEGPASVPLSQMQPGPVVVRRISEKVEIDEDAIAFLAGAELTPGSNAEVVGTSADGVRVKSATGDQTVPRKLAQLIYAIPA